MLFRATTTLPTRLHFRCTEKLNIVLPDIWRSQMLLASLPIYHWASCGHISVLRSCQSDCALDPVHWNWEDWILCRLHSLHIQNWHLIRPSLSQNQNLALVELYQWKTGMARRWKKNLLSSLTASCGEKLTTLVNILAYLASVRRYRLSRATFFMP